MTGRISALCRSRQDAPSQSELNRGILLKLGVPAGAIETFGTANTNTRDEPARLWGFSPAGPVGARVAANSITIVLADASFLLHSQGATRRETLDWNTIPSNIDENPSRAWDW